MGLELCKGELCPQFCILVVEDELMIRMDVVEGFTAAGLRVVEAGSADEALALLKTTGDVDLVFTDVRMPGAIDGLELARWMKLERPGLPVFITSAHLSASSTEGLGVFLPKPYSLEKVVALVVQTLEDA